MTRMKTADLIGAQLDWAVAKAEGRAVQVVNSELILVGVEACYECGYGFLYAPSTDWRDGGSIIDRERISTTHIAAKGWSAVMDGARVETEFGPAVRLIRMYGDTPLIAAMRAFVASKLGDEVEVPEVSHG